MCCMNHQYKWEENLPLVEFSYKKSYHSSLGMAPFEALYGHKCHTPINWDRVEDMIVVSSKMLKEMEEQKVLIYSGLKEAADRQKNYADKRTFREFQDGDKVFLRVRL